MRTRLDPIGFTYHADCYCYECGVTLPDIDPEGNAKGVIAPWDEFTWQDDYGNEQPYGCGQCGEVIA